MGIRDLKVLNNCTPINLPTWINFAFILGAFISEHGIKYKKPANVIISLPSEHFFSLFIAMGIADKGFSVNKQMRSIRKAVLNLEKGSRIIYQDDKSRRKVSVISIEPSPVFQDEMILKIKDGKIERGIPERQWIERVILLDEEYDQIKRTIKVNKKKQVGLEASPLLRVLYSSSQLNKVSFYPGDAFYIVGNVKQIYELIDKEIFICDHCKGSVKDFLYIDNNCSYKNGRLFSSQMKKIQADISNELPVIYSDINSYLKQFKNFIKNPSIIITSRCDNENRLVEVKEKIKIELLQRDYKIITSEINDYVKNHDAQIPNGIEYFSWR
ncbi:hypothetical protein ACPUYX_11300 [Desulfosporosinus sp. SYSU MS00001]|uniref:hypothetical protein n=1 Tax=Desulfosporosinus sp. SYSU MS00001 TaxID=3416284 RepID=UPI003CED4203